MSTINPGRARSLAFQEWVKRHHPRARRLAVAERCHSMRNGAPVKAYWKRDGGRQDDQAIIDRYRCKNAARWSFRHLKRGWERGATHSYCWSHLYWRALFGSMEETEATERAMVRTGYARPDQTATQNH